MIKLVVTDIDGTLVADGENQVNPRLFELIADLKEKKARIWAAMAGICFCIPWREGWRCRWLSASGRIRTWR